MQSKWFDRLFRQEVRQPVLMLVMFLLVTGLLACGTGIPVGTQTGTPEPFDTPTSEMETPVTETPAGDRPIPENVVRDPESGQWVLKDELIILSSGQDVRALVSKYDGKIVLAVEETGSYQVRFPVTSLEELAKIQRELEKQGLQVYLATVILPGSD